MGLFKHLLRGWMGERYSGHHGKHRYGNYGPPPDTGYRPSQMSASTCPQCETRNTPEARFCAQCGIALHATACHACGKDVPPAAKFCPECGQSIRKTSA